MPKLTCRRWAHKPFCWFCHEVAQINWAAPSEFGTYRLCEQRRFRRACASAQSRQNLRCSLIQAVRTEEPSDGKPDPWPLWMAGHAQLKFVMTECSKTQIRLTRPNFSCFAWTIITIWFHSWPLAIELPRPIKITPQMYVRRSIMYEKDTFCLPEEYSSLAQLSVQLKFDKLCFLLEFYSQMNKA